VLRTAWLDGARVIERYRAGFNINDPAVAFGGDRVADPSDTTAGTAAHALFRRPDVYPVLRDFHEIAATGWYGHPARAEPARAEEVFEAVADHVVARAREIWAALDGQGRS